jgi:TolB-like protein/Flp pilus assembly protein TadD/tRNA A-37 threonylcarbamoyl transferase component Bud32
MIGQTISHYKILEKLGEGGMGVVYKAQDTKLDRLVALKFLPQHLTANEAEKARFLQEAKAASALNHPNVCTIYGIEEHESPDGTSQQFIDMEYVDGVTLREKIGEAGLKVQDALTYAIQVGEALAEAHSKGIVHRDIKCENIMVNSKNQVKVMDFGLAKLKGTLKLTRTSSTVGTLAYMSPEQIQGGEVDSRSDIFSFGVVFYEMLTGHIPFRGEHEAAMMYSIVNEEPTPADKFRPELSAECLQILRKALEKDPEDRYQHVVDMVVDLRRVKKQSTRVSRLPISQEMMVAAVPKEPVSSVEQKAVSDGGPRKKVGGKTYVIAGAALVLVAAVAFLLLHRETSGPAQTSQGRRMLAVLPFENLGTPEQDYFADGLTEEVTNRLSGLSGLGVIARTSAMQYKKTTKSLQQIGSELHVGYVLQGTIRWGMSGEGGTRIRVSPVLIRVSDGTQVWAQSYDAVFSDVFKIQSDIASQVAGALGITLLQPERKSLEASHTEDSQAYDFYLRGNNYAHRSIREQDFQIGIQMFEKAVELDPKFALAYAKLSETHSAMYWYHYDHTKERLAKAKAAVDEALRLDPDLADARASLGFYYYWGFLDYDDALKEFVLAQKSRPNDSRVLLGIGAVQRRQGKFELAAATMTKATELDPRSSELAWNTSETYRLLRDYSTAERFIDQAIALSPDLASGYQEKALLELLWLGNTKPARAVIQKASSITGAEDDMAILFIRAWIEMFDGNYSEALVVASSGSRKPFDEQFQFVPRAQLLAEIYGLMGRRDLEKANYDSARVELEKRIKEQPDDARFHSALGIAYAGLGRKQDAIKEGKLGVELLPISKEAWRGTYRVRDLARIYTMVGEQSAAIDLLRDLLSRPSDLSVPWLRIDPTWAPLRNNPRFQKLIAENAGS